MDPNKNCLSLNSVHILWLLFGISYNFIKFPCQCDICPRRHRKSLLNTTQLITLLWDLLGANLNGSTLKDNDIHGKQQNSPKTKTMSGRLQNS